MIKVEDDCINCSSVVVHNGNFSQLADEAVAKHKSIMTRLVQEYIQAEHWYRYKD